jgi:predicted nucleic acid-binding protein
VHPITAETGELAGRIAAECSRHGDVVPLGDLMIGCCALELGYGVATRNERHFRKIPGLELIQL